MSDRMEATKRSLLVGLVRGQGTGGVKPLVERNEALAVAAVGLQEALLDLVASERPSPWRAVGFVLATLEREPADFDNWQPLLEEVEAAVAVTDGGDNSASERLLLQLDGLLDELTQLAGH